MVACRRRGEGEGEGWRGEIFLKITYLFFSSIIVILVIIIILTIATSAWS